MTTRPHSTAGWATCRRYAGSDTAAPLEALALPATNWEGLPVRLLPLPGDMEVEDFLCPQPSLAIARQGRGRRRYTVGTRVRELYSSPMMFELYEAGFFIDHAVWQGVQGEVVSIQLPAPMVNRLLQSEGAGLTVPTRHELFDQRVADLGLALWEEAHAGAPSGPLYAQGLTLALLGLLTERHGVQPGGGAGRTASRLTPAHRERIRAHIAAHLSMPLTVDALAEQVGLSPHHFARAFKATFGVSPHAYVTERRLDAAMRQLRAASEDSIAEVASGVGFSSQSHFTEVFRRRIGTTPARWRAGR